MEEKRMKATKRAIEKLQNIYGVLGTYGGIILTKDPNAFKPIVFEIGSITDNTAKAMLGSYQTNKKRKKEFGLQFFLEIKFRDGRIKDVEIKKFRVSHEPWDIEVEEDGFEIIEGKPSGGFEDLKRLFSHFMGRIMTILLFVNRDLATITKYEEAIDDKVVSC